MLTIHNRIFVKICLVISLTMFLGACANRSTSSNSSNSSTTSASGSAAAAATAAPVVNFPEKDITFVIPSSTGGSHDTFARALFPIWQSYLPKKVNFIADNRPGELTIGTGTVYKAKPDGYTLGDGNIPGMNTPVMQGKDVYDLDKFTWIGRLTTQYYVMAVPKKSPINSIEDFIKAGKPVTLGISGGLSSTSGLSSTIVADTLKIKFKQVNHPTSQDAAIATIRGDLDAVHIPFDSLQGFIESGDLKPIFLFTKEKMKGFEKVQIPADVGHPELADLVSMQILVFGPPNLSKETTKILRDTFMQAVKDPKYLEWAKSVKREVVPLHGDEVGPMVKASLESYMKYKDLVK